jgi:hypothetical protein
MNGRGISAMGGNHSHPTSEVLLAWCGTIVECAVGELLGGSGWSSGAGFEGHPPRRGVQGKDACSTSREMPVRMTKGHQRQKHINRGTLSRGPC